MPLLTIDIEARFAQAIDAVNALTKKVEGMDAVFRKAQGAAAKLGLAFSGAALAHFIKGSIDAQDALNDLSKSTGVAIATLGGLGFAAKQSGSDLEGVAQAMGKLNLNIAKAAAGNEEAAAAFKAVGISVRDAKGNIKSGDQVFTELADKFAKFRDGPNKAALGMAFFGKTYQAIIPLLDEGGAKIRANVEYWQKFSGVTQQSAEDADELNDQLEKVKLHFDAIGTRLANEIVPGLLTMAEAMTKLQEESGLVVTVAKGFAEVFKVVVVLGANVAYVFTKIGEEAAGMAAQLKALATLDFETFTALRDEMVKRAEEDRKAIDKFSEMVLHPPEREAPKKPDGKKEEAPGLPDPKAAAEALALRKAALDAQLKQLDAFAADEAELLRARNAANSEYYEAGLIAIQHFFDLQDEVQAEAVEKQRKLFEEEAAALREFAGDVSVPVKDRVEAMQKLGAVTEKQAKLEVQAAENTTKAWFARNKAVQDALDQITELAAKTAEIEGRTDEAAAIRRGVQNRALRQFLETNQPGNVQQLDDLEKRQGALEKFNRQMTENGRTFAELGRNERDIQDALLKGEINQTEAMERTDRARRAALPVLEAELEKAREAARTSTDPEAIERVKELEQSLKDLAATSDSVGQRMRGVFEDAFIDPFVDLVNKTKTADQALKAFFNNIAQALLRIEAQNIAQTIFGGVSGSGGGVFGLVGGFLGFAGGPDVSGATLAGAQAGTSATDLAKYFGYTSAAGNIMTDRGPLKLERFARGGIARRPMLSIFGEGSQPEAYVPLPDGRRIPVAMTGSSGGRLQAGPSAITGWQQARAPAVTLQLHPDAMTMTLRDWFESELARTAATR